MWHSRSTSDKLKALVLRWIPLPVLPPSSMNQYAKLIGVKYMEIFSGTHFIPVPEGENTTCYKKYSK